MREDEGERKPFRSEESMIRKAYPIFIFLATILTGCLGCQISNGGDGESVVCDFAFREAANSNTSVFRTIITGDIAYTYECSSRPHSIMAYDLKNRVLKWRSYPYAENADWKYDSAFFANFCQMGEFLWIPWYYDDMNYLMGISTLDGSRKKLVVLGRASAGIKVYGVNTVSDGSRVFFFTPEGLAFCDVDAAPLVDSETSTYQGSVVLVCPFDSVRDYGIFLEKANGSVVCSYRNYDDDVESGLFRVDIASSRRVWTIKGEVFLARFAIDGGRVISATTTRRHPDIFIERFVSYDWDTGDLLADYESGMTTNDPPLRYGDVIIQSSIEQSDMDESLPMLYCLDAETLALRWKVNVDLDNPFFGSRCQVNNGIVYQPRAPGMWLYDLDTGEFLGKDASFEASDPANVMVSFRYEDILIISNGHELLGIKMNFRKTPNGLVKE